MAAGQVGVVRRTTDCRTACRSPGGSATDALLRRRQLDGPMIASGKLEKLNDLLGSAESPLKIDDACPASRLGYPGSVVILALSLGVDQEKMLLTRETGLSRVSIKASSQDFSGAGQDTDRTGQGRQAVGGSPVSCRRHREASSWLPVGQSGPELHVGEVEAPFRVVFPRPVARAARNDSQAGLLFRRIVEVEDARHSYESLVIWASSR